MANKKITIFDNGGNTVDRYTGVISASGDIVGFNENPFHPCGFGQFCGNVTDRMNVTYGYGWRNHFNEKKILKQELIHYLKEAKGNSEWLGKEVSIEQLSPEAKKYIHQILIEE
ncbi:hypothetical protein [Aurantibacillus circumpalustris]|uniref:hypothetical protein n=1 Tax=Aurantibacillus circumpalustris TaxID=3036359 RepID=UPI00295C39E7|nr:hypothetical protein [Aurantibacillus circumpalustris]